MKSALLVGWTFLLTGLTVVMGAIPLNGLYRYAGRLYYWLFWALAITTLFYLGFYPLAVGLCSMCFVVGVFNEVRRNGYSYVSSGVISVAFTSTLIYFFAFFFARIKEIKWVPFFETYLNDNVLKYFPPTGDGAIPFDIKQVIVQIPSIGVILLIVSLFLAVLFEKRILIWLQIPTLRREKLREFSLPDTVIWIFILSLLLAFIKLETTWVNVVGMNLLNVVVLLYFFQGLAVIATYLHLTKATIFWRTLIYVFAITQLFLAVAVFGIIDYWMDFRRKLNKKMTEIKNL